MKITRSRILLPAVLWMIISVSAAVFAAEGNPPFFPGEKLTFQLKWGDIPAGEVVFETLPPETFEGTPSYHFVMTTRSSDFVDRIYKVRNRIDAYVDTMMTHSLFYRKKQREGGHKRDVEVNFDWTKQETQYINSGKKRKPVSIPPGTFDPLSVFYAFRLHEFKENTEVEAPVTDGKRVALGKARVVTREKVNVASGEYDTYLVEADLKDLNGIFQKNKSAKLQVWVTADPRRIPVRVRSEVMVGSFTGELVSVSHPLR